MDILNAVLAVAQQEGGFKNAFQGGFLDLGGPDGSLCKVLGLIQELVDLGTDINDAVSRSEDGDEEPETYAEMLANYIVEVLVLVYLLVHHK